MYTRRKQTFNSKILKQALETWTLLLAPFAPYICEEIWSKLNKSDFISLTDWPVYDKTKINVEAEETENLVKNVLEDTSNILRATKMVPKEIYYYSAASWKWKVYLTALKQKKRSLEPKNSEEGSGNMDPAAGALCTIHVRGNMEQNGAQRFCFLS